MAQRYAGEDGRLGDVLARLEPTLGPLGATPTPLDGGITNRNFRVMLGESEYMVRVHGRDTDLLGIDRDAERLASETAAGLRIAPEVAAALEDCLVTRFVACDQAGPPEIAEHVEELARALRSFHDSGVRLPTTFWVPALLADYEAIVRERGHALPDAYREALEVAGQIAAALPASDARPCHNDLLAGNVIRSRDDGSMLIVDWEYAGMGHPCFDLGNLSINNDFDDDTDERLLSAYDGHAPTCARRATLKLMRVLSDAREAAWGVVQGVVSELDFDFDAYAREHFERLRAAVDGPGFQQWLGEVAQDGQGGGRGQAA